MICQIKSTWIIAVLLLVAWGFLAGGCFDASSSRTERSQETTSRDRMSRTDAPNRRNDRPDRPSRHTESETIRPTTDVTTIQPEAKAAQADTPPPSMAWFDSGKSEQESSLPKTINWDIPEVTKANAEEKITAASTGIATSEIVVDTVADVAVEVSAPPEQKKHVIAIDMSQEPEPVQTVQDTTQGDGVENPFAGIGESTNDVIPLPRTDEVIGESVWEQAQSPGHELLEHLTIPKTDNAVTKPKTTNAPTDAEWKAVEPNPEPFTSGPVVTGNQAEPTVEPVIDPTLVPVLPSVQDDGGDPFGIDAAEAFDQFNQAFGGEATPQSTPSQDDTGFDWGETPSPFDATEPGETQATPQQPATPSTSIQPQSSQSSQSDSDDDLPPVGRLTPVEQYLINEAKLSPVKLMESVELLYKLNKPLLARRLLRQLITMELTEDDCQQIRNRINPAILLRLSLDPDKEYPEGREAVQKILGGAKRIDELQAIIEDAMQRLLTGTDREKDNARRTILSYGETSIKYLLERLAASSDQDELSEIMSLLVAMGESARRAMQESLVTTTPLGMRTARLLTQMGRASDARFLLPMMFDSRLNDEERSEAAEMVKKLSHNVPNQVKAAETLYSMASNYFRGKVPFMTDADNKVSFWMLKEGEELPIFITDGEDVASRYFAEKFARFATCLAPQKPTYRQLWLVAFFDLKGAEMGSDNSITLDENLLQAMLAGLTIDDVESALRFAMQQGKPIAARVAAELMGEFSDVEVVIYKRGSQSALVKAAGFSDRRVRFAALQSIIKLQPNRSYPGSSTVSQSLVYFTRATGKKRAVVVAPWLGEATSLATLLDPLGYTSEAATTGRQAMQLAISSADTELMMLDVRTPSSNVEFLIQDMRSDNRTHDVPIAVLAAGWVVSRAERASYGDNRIGARDVQDTKNSFTIDGKEYLVFGINEISARTVVNKKNRLDLTIGGKRFFVFSDEELTAKSVEDVKSHLAVQAFSHGHIVGGDKNRQFIIGDDEFIVDRDMMTRAERAAFGSKMAHAFPRPYDEASTKFVVDNLLRRSGVEIVPQQIRLAEAKQSIQWVTELYQQSNIYRFENIEQIAWDTLWLPELTTDTLPLVELIPTVNAQRWLTHIVSTPGFDIETRKAALKAFEKNADSYGVLIRGRQILDLYDMYNASGNEPVASQQARNDLLDVVERHADYMQKVNYQK